MALDRRRITGLGSLVLATVLALAAWFFLVLVSARPGFRKILDMTPGQTASVRTGTETLIRKLQRRDGERIEIYTLFEPLPNGQTPPQRALVAIYRRVQNMTVSLLRQYAALGGEKLQVRHIDSRREPDVARKILDRLGGVETLHVVVVAVVRESEDGKETIRKRVIPVADLAVVDTGGGRPVPGGGSRMPRLELFTGEEQLSSAMKTLLAGGTPVVYLVKGHGEFTATRSDPYDYTNLVSGLQERGFKVSDLNIEKQGIPEDAMIVASLEPEKPFLDSECEQVHAFLKRGGRFFLNLKYTDPGSRNPLFEKLLAPLGLRTDKRMVAQMWNNARANKAVALEIAPRNTALPITRPLVESGRKVGLTFARPIFPTREAVPGMSFDGSLLRTEKQCWLAQRIGPTETSYVPPRDPSDYASHCVGAIVTVRQDTGDHAGRVIVIGGLGFQNRVVETGAQKDFALNCFAWLADRREQIELEARDDKPRSDLIERSTNPDVVAAKHARSRYLLVFGVPAGFMVLGLFVWWRRRRI